MKVVCAWCPGFRPGQPAEMTSHGICRVCLARLLDAEPPKDDERDQPEDEERESNDPDDDPRETRGEPIDFHE